MLYPSELQPHFLSLTLYPELYPRLYQLAQISPKIGVVGHRNLLKTGRTARRPSFLNSRLAVQVRPVPPEFRS
jgi:hypothetical protein